jgi:hypothetical protein
MTPSAAIRAEFERRRREGQAGVDRRTMDRDVVNRNLSLWRDILAWAEGEVPLGPIDHLAWARATRSAAYKAADRGERDHALALRAASIRLDAIAETNRQLRARADAERKERIAA